MENYFIRFPMIQQFNYSDFTIKKKSRYLSIAENIICRGPQSKEQDFSFKTAARGINFYRNYVNFEASKETLGENMV